MPPDLLPIISPSDVVRAWRRLRARDDETRRAIAAALGFEWQEGKLTPSAVSESAQPAPAPETLPAEESSVTKDAVESGVVPRTSGRAAPATTPVRSELTPLPPRSPDDTWLLRVEPLPQVAEDRPPPLPLEPLFQPGWARALLSGALATLGADGPLDLPQLIEWIAQGLPVQRLPMLQQPTLVLGVQLLLDRSDAMIPFHRDQSWLVRQLRQTVGKERVAVLHFSGSPRRGAGLGPRHDWEPYMPPGDGAPVLAVTDLGVGQPLAADTFVDESEWLLFADDLVRAGSPLVILTPYPPRRWPPALARRLLILHWERTTTISHVHSRVGKGRQTS